MTREPGSSSSALWSLIRRAEPSAALLAAAAVAGLAGVLATLLFPLLTKQLIDELGNGDPRAASIATLAAVLLAGAAASALSSYLLVRVGLGAVATLRHQLVDKILALPIPAFDRSSSGAWVSRVLSDCQSSSELASRQAVKLLTGILLLIGSETVLALQDGHLTLMLLGCLGIAFLIVIPLATLLEGLAHRTQDRTARLGSILTHVFSVFCLVFAFVVVVRERARSGQEIEDIRRIGVQEARINAGLEPLMTLALTAAVIAILAFGASRVSHGVMTIGTLTAFILYILNVATPLMQLTQFTAEYQKAKGASARIAMLLGEEEEGRALPSGYVSPGDRGTSLQFVEVSFAYPGRAEARVLHGIDLVFHPGTTSALVGASGNGKTTVLSLILRFYEPTEGVILYRGRPITEFTLAEWRSRIGYVAQGAPIMPGSVRDNITYGLTEHCSEEQVRTAAERAGAWEFIEQMPAGLDTPLIEQGYNLSGGQRQRIAIARMFLRDPDILILDEATSNLDSETEHQVKAALSSLMRGRTNIVVAHRLSTIMHAHCIYFLENGRVSGVGNHAQLSATHPYYAKLVARHFHRTPEKVMLEPMPDAE